MREQAHPKSRQLVKRDKQSRINIAHEKWRAPCSELTVLQYIYKIDNQIKWCLQCHRVVEVWGTVSC